MGWSSLLEDIQQRFYSSFENFRSETEAASDRENKKTGKTIDIEYNELDTVITEIFQKFNELINENARLRDCIVEKDDEVSRVNRLLMESRNLHKTKDKRFEILNSKLLTEKTSRNALRRQHKLLLHRYERLVAGKRVITKNRKIE